MGSKSFLGTLRSKVFFFFGTFNKYKSQPQNVHHFYGMATKKGSDRVFRVEFGYFLAVQVTPIRFVWLVAQMVAKCIAILYSGSCSLQSCESKMFLEQNRHHDKNWPSSSRRHQKIKSVWFSSHPNQYFL